MESRFGLLIITLSILSFQHYIIGDDYCTTYSPDCKYKCRCRPNDEGSCDGSTGRCDNNGPCSPGWMGDACQFADIAHGKNHSELTDGSITTCSEHKTLDIDLAKNYPVYSFRVHRDRTHGHYDTSIKLAVVRNSTGDTISFMNTCVQSYALHGPDYDVFCTHTIFGRYLTLEFDSVHRICEIEMYGGRNIALWKYSNQSGKYKHYSSKLAVDGKVGNFMFSSGSCSHTKAEEETPAKIPWWRVDFNQTYLIQRMKISFRAGVLIRFDGYKYSVFTNTQPYSIKTQGVPNKEEEIIFPNPILGHSVEIRLPDHIQDADHNLELCEVEVFACRPFKIGTQGTCNDFCPSRCNVQHSTCENFICPNNQCIGNWKGKYCNQKECLLRDLSNRHLKRVNSTKTQFLTEDTIKVRCEEGYRPQGESSVSCSETGNWTNNVACKANTCSIPSLHGIHINVTGSSVTFNTAVKLSCGRGYTLRANTCSITSLHGVHINVTGSSVTFNTAVKLSCDRGYTLRGPSTYICQLSGQWNQEWNTATSSCETNTCSIPSLHGILINVTGSSVIFNTAVKLSCDRGYTLRGPSTYICQLSGQWNQEWNTATSVCEENRCSIPALNDTHIIVNSTSTSSVKFDMNISLSCDKGYSLQGLTDYQCKPDGNWTNEWTVKSSRCEANTCTIPNVDAQLNVSSAFHPVTFGNHVPLSCADGYTVRGPDVFLCLPDGTWNQTWNSTYCEAMPKTKSSKDPSAAAIGGGSTAAVVVVVVVVVIVIVVLRRKRTNAKDGSRQNQHMDTNMDEIKTHTSGRKMDNKEDSVRESSADDPSSYYEFTPKQEISNHAIDVAMFKDYVEENKGENGKIRSQFLKLKSGLQFPAEVALSQQNRTKNKYKNICAYDQTRVLLKHSKGQNQSDYINACYINGYNTLKTYIASQGPIDSTEEDFWEMVYQQGSNKIVMLTNLIEEGKRKCEQYWPDQGSLKFGSMEIRHRSIDRFAEFTIRHLAICKNEGKWRNIQQFHFTSWPDKGVPKYASSLVNFRNKVMNTSSAGKGPLIVHCSAGVGRTGTFIALDYLVNQANEVQQVDVFTCVETLRRQRVNMVQTADQYVFLHCALEEALMCKTYATSSADFPEVFAKLQQKDLKSGRRGIEIEFAILQETSPVLQEKEFESGKSEENKAKNRYSNIIPVESHRIYLYTYAQGRNDYINAVIIPGYRESKAFIATQMPLPDTTIDFLRLVCENDVASIIMLNEDIDEKHTVHIFTNHSPQQVVPFIWSYTASTTGKYWPEKSNEISIGPFVIETSGKEHMNNVCVETLKIKFESKEPRVIKLFRVQFWPEGEQIPRSASDLLALLEYVQQWQRSTGNNPTVVHCMNGCDKVGLYCVVATTIERLKIEQDVGIQQIIKQMRSRRPQIIPSIEQFEFCQEAVLEYMKQFETYSNFQ